LDGQYSFADPNVDYSTENVVLIALDKNAGKEQRGKRDKEEKGEKDVRDGKYSFAVPNVVYLHTL
jgi:hypothetical protein